MTPRRRLFGAIAVSVCATSLVVPAMAGAAGPKAGEKTFQQTYPLASKLCASTVAGTEGKHLKRSATQVLADCTTLQSAFTAAQTTVLAARTTLTAQITADRALVTTACPTPKDTAAVCVQTRTTENKAIATLRAQRLAAVRHYYKTVEANRAAFWKAIRALPGEGHVHADQPIPVTTV
jgi:hypothetical protein